VDRSTRTAMWPSVEGDRSGRASESRPKRFGPQNAHMNLKTGLPRSEPGASFLRGAANGLRRLREVDDCRGRDHAGDGADEQSKGERLGVAGRHGAAEASGTETHLGLHI